MACNDKTPTHNSLGKQLAQSLLLAAVAVVFAVLFHSTEGSDRSGYGMVVLGLMIGAVPFVLGCSALSFVFRNTVIGTALGGTAFTVAVFMGTLLAMN
ncbi:MAG TPA: hypothetical protein V6C76_04590 [Drouetiella sp.]